MPARLPLAGTLRARTKSVAFRTGSIIARGKKSISFFPLAPCDQWEAQPLQAEAQAKATGEKPLAAFSHLACSLGFGCLGLRALVGRLLGAHDRNTKAEGFGFLCRVTDAQTAGKQQQQNKPKTKENLSAAACFALRFRAKKAGFPAFLGNGALPFCVMSCFAAHNDRCAEQRGSPPLVQAAIQCALHKRL